MNKETSIYLDIVRLTAAMVVFIGHVSGQRLTGGLFWQIGAFMDDAVVIFFVLSGFVIAHVTQRPDITAPKYAAGRAARMYSVAVPALIITFCLDIFGRAIQPDSYSSVWGYSSENIALQILSSIFFINQLWYLHITPGSMLPYWSLGFEVWYYIIFGFTFFTEKKIRIILIACLLLIVGPRIALFMPLWLIGYYTYHYTGKSRFNIIEGALIFILSLAIYAVYIIFAKQEFSEIIILKNIFDVDNFFNRYTVALIFSINLIGFCALSPYLKDCFKIIENPIRWFAGATFTIYLLHVPIAQFLSVITPWKVDYYLSQIFVFLTTFFSMLIIAQYTERRKHVWLVFFNKLFLLRK